MSDVGTRDLARHPYFLGDAHRHGPDPSASLFDQGPDGHDLQAATPSRQAPARDDAILEVAYGTVALNTTNAHELVAFDPQRASISIYNLGPGNVYLGTSRGVRAGGGNTTVIPAGGKINNLKDRNALYVIADQALTTVTYNAERYGQ